MTFPPICPWNTFLSGVDYFKDRGGPPDIVFRSSFPNISPRMRSRLTAALRGLKLIDREGKTQPSFRSLVEARNTGQWPIQLRILITNAFPYTAPLDLVHTDNDQLHKAFVAYTKRDTRNLAKAEVFFLNLARASGLKLSDSLQKRVFASEARTTAHHAGPKPEANMTPPKKPTATTKVAPGSRKDAAVKTNTKPQMSAQERVEKIMDLLRMFSGEGLPAKELTAVMTLLDYAKRKAAEA
jgi:hypothetical protein